MSRSRWMPVLGLVVLGWAGFGVYAIVTASSRETIDAEGCPAPAGAKATTLIAVDTTDGIDLAATQAGMARVAAELVEGGRLSLFVIDGDPANAMKPRLSRCKPRDPARADGRTENPRLIEQDYRRKFQGPLEAVVASLAAIPQARESNIIAGLEAALWSDAWRQAKGQRTIVVHSNLLEHASYASHLKGPLTDVCTVLAGPLGERLRSHVWKDVRVDLLYQRDARFADRQGSTHLAWWTALFAELGTGAVRESGRILTLPSPTCAAKAKAASPTLINGSTDDRRGVRPAKAAAAKPTTKE